MLSKRQISFLKILEEKELSPELRFSTTTEKFYLSSILWIKDGCMAKGICEHRITPEEAVDAYIEAVTSNSMVADIHGICKEFCFVEVTQ